jgi:hypothetical protein
MTGTPIFDELASRCDPSTFHWIVDCPGSSPCTPVGWFGPVVPPVRHARVNDTQVIPAVGERAS